MVFNSDKARENMDLSLSFAQNGDWDNAVKYARLVPNNWDVWQQFPTIAEGGLSAEAMNKILNYLPKDNKDNFLFEASSNLHPSLDHDTLERMAKLGLDDYSVQKALQNHPNWKPDDKLKGAQNATKFWNSYESRVRPHHFATIKSFFTGKPETTKTHRGEDGSTETAYIANGQMKDHRDLASENPNQFMFHSNAHEHIVNNRKNMNDDNGIHVDHIIPHLTEHAKKVQHAIMNDEFIPKRYFNGKAYIKLHRGIGGSYAKKLREKIKHNPENHEIDHKNFILPTAHLTSWTTDPEMAERFASTRGEHDNVHDAGVVISAWHPVENILHSGFHAVTPGQTHMHHTESEIVMGHPAGKMKINSKNIRFQNPQVEGVPKGGQVNILNENEEYPKLKEMADKGRLKMKDLGGYAGVDFIHENFTSGRARKAEDLLEGLKKIRDLLKKSISAAGGTGVAALSKSWEVKVKGREGYHPVKDIQDLGPEKGNNYILHSGRVFHQSQLEDMRPVSKPVQPKQPLSQKKYTAQVVLPIKKYGHAAEESIDELEKSNVPRFKGEKHPDKPYVADRHSFGVTWFYNPETAKKYENDIQANRQGFLAKFPSEHHAVVNRFIDHVMSQRNRHCVVAQDVRGGPDMPRARHLRGLLMGDRNYALKVHDPENLTLTSFERHGEHNPRGSDFKFNLKAGLQKSQKYALKRFTGLLPKKSTDSQNEGSKDFLNSAETYSISRNSDTPRKGTVNELRDTTAKGQTVVGTQVPKAPETHGRKNSMGHESTRSFGLHENVQSVRHVTSGRDSKASGQTQDRAIAKTDSPTNGKKTEDFKQKIAKTNLCNPTLVNPPKKLAKSNLPQIATIAVMDGNTLVMGKRSDNDRWTCPGGHMEAGEDPLTGAQRELLEETGINAPRESISYLGSEPVTTFTGKQIVVHCFLVKGQFKTDSSNDPDAEVREWQYVDLSKGLPETIAKNLHSPKNTLLKKLGLQ